MKILYIDMDNTLVDFGAKLEGIDQTLREEYRGREDELPGLFALMPPMAGALDAFAELSTIFDTYILSTAPGRTHRPGSTRSSGSIYTSASTRGPRPTNA